MESPPDSPAGNELRSPFGSASFPPPGLRLEIAARFPHRPLKCHQQQMGLPTRFSEEATIGLRLLGRRTPRWASVIWLAF